MKRRIDIYFSENYLDLLELARKHIKYHKRNYDPVDVVSFVYEYILERRKEFCNQDIESIAYRMIMTSCYWNNSKLNRDILLTQTPFEGTQDKEAIPVEREDTQTQEKIELEKWFNDKKALLALYRERIRDDKPKQIVLDKILELQTTNSRKIGKHFDIHYLSAYAYIREIQEEIQDFEVEVNTYDKKNNLTR